MTISVPLSVTRQRLGVGAEDGRVCGSARLPRLTPACAMFGRNAGPGADHPQVRDDFLRRQRHVEVRDVFGVGVRQVGDQPVQDARRVALAAADELEAFRGREHPRRDELPAMARPQSPEAPRMATSIWRGFLLLFVR